MIVVKVGRGLVLNVQNQFLMVAVLFWLLTLCVHRGGIIGCENIYDGHQMDEFVEDFLVFLGILDIGEELRVELPEVVTEPVGENADIVLDLDDNSPSIHCVFVYFSTM